MYAFIAVGLGALGTDALEMDPRRRVDYGMLYFFMMLASLFWYALYQPSWWAKFAQLALSISLVLALWQKVRDRAPLLLDPVATPRCLRWPDCSAWILCVSRDARAFARSFGLVAGGFVVVRACGRRRCGGDALDRRVLEKWRTQPAGDLGIEDSTDGSWARCALWLCGRCGERRSSLDVYVDRKPRYISQAIA